MRTIRIILLLAIFASGVGLFCLADDISDNVSQYYRALAKIINKNMDDPEKALNDVSLFVRRNMNFINSVREMRNQQKSTKRDTSSALMSSSSPSSIKERSGIEIFNKIMEEFKRKHPGQAHKFDLLGIHAILKPL